ncbi:putative Colicin V secretion protein [Xenorhabdus nematophila F1]|uniref:HlyD family secretion protein n=1 Tax=Xenorhabdus nematophila TaxID=628 RepID=UPI00032752E3|nr:HlyD family efflux transporter periplasmic adaptor subunit [Xenorhabdus nematophila]CCW31363.1 putative Colicin V secretion protein [Xenorhabdus nematophila F1]
MSTETEKNDNSIFRAEALQHKREGWLGASRLHIPSALSICCLTILVIFFFIILIIAFGSYSERINVIGTVVYKPPAVSLIAQSSGIITHSLALEQTRVKRNESIFSISGDTQTNLGATNVETVELLNKQRNALSKKLDIAANESKANKIYLSEKIKNKQQEIESLQNLIETSEKQQAWFEKKSNLYANFKKKGIALDAEWINRKKDYYASTLSISSAKVKVIALLGELQDLKNDVSAIDRKLDKETASLTVEIADIAQKILITEKQKEYLIVAPFDGMITSVTAHIGERVTAGQQIAVLIPQGATEKVELFSPSDSLGEVTSGQQVRMRVSAYPYQWYGKIAGIIETISAAPVNVTSQMQMKGEEVKKGLFRIVVQPKLTGQQTNISLLPGMEVETEIYVKTRKLYEWLFIPIKGAYERATDSTE